MPERALLQMRYWDTYYYAQVVHNLLVHPEHYLRLLEDFFGDLRYRGFLAPYPRWTPLHRFVEQAFYGILDESVDDIMVDGIVHKPEYEPWVTEALNDHGIDHPTIRDWLPTLGYSLGEVEDNAIHQYHDHLASLGALGTLAAQLAEEVFFLTFLNRNLLRRLHEEIAERIREADPEHESPQDAAHFERRGMLRRVRPPRWAQRAVFFRDRGACTFCHCDLSGLLSSQAVEAYDHIVPLADGGANDVTNLQLLCQACNARKGAGSARAGDEYERWYPTG